VVSRQQRHRTLLLMELVSGRPFDRADVIERAHAMGWDLHVPRAALVMRVNGADGPMPIAGTPLEEPLLRAVQPAAGSSAIAWALEWTAALLVEPRPSPRHVARAVHDAAVRVRPDAQVTVALGRVHEDIADLHHSYHEAQEALRLAQELHRPDGVVEHDELGVYRLFLHVPTHELRTYCEEMLGPLLDYDRRHSGSLLRTLETYLRAGRNGVVASRELFVHYNTLRYRLEQIEKLTGGIDRHPTSRLGLEAAIHAHRLLRARSVAAPDAPALGAVHGPPTRPAARGLSSGVTSSARAPAL
jgi:purine catabolism regulator